MTRAAPSARSMLAIRYAAFGGPEVLEPEWIAVPRLGPDDILVALEAASVTPLDCKLRAGRMAAHFTPELPKIPGRDGVGVILAVGSEVKGFKPGDRVGVMAPPAAAAGTHAGAICCRAGQLVMLRAELGPVEATALINAGLSAWIAAETAGIRRGQRVLVHAGAGAVGGVLVQLAAHLGAQVTATCRASNRDHVRALGARAAVAYDTEDFTALPAQDIVFDLVGGEVHERSYRVLAPGGHLVWLTAAPIVDRGKEFGVRVSRAPVTDDPAVVAAIWRLAAQGIIRPQVAGRLPLVRAREAHRRLEAGEVTRGRLVLEIAGAVKAAAAVTDPSDGS